MGHIVIISRVIAKKGGKNSRLTFYLASARKIMLTEESTLSYLRDLFP